MLEHYRRKFFDLVVSTFLHTGLLDTCMAPAYGTQPAIPSLSEKGQVLRALACRVRRGRLRAEFRQHPPPLPNSLGLDLTQRQNITSEWQNCFSL
jgi:hypothetical protein